MGIESVTNVLNSNFVHEIQSLVEEVGYGCDYLRDIQDPDYQQMADTLDDARTRVERHLYG